MVETEWATNDVTIWRIRVTYWISKATCTYAYAHAHGRTQALSHTQAQICNIYCFSTAKMIRERASVLRYTYIVCVGNNVIDCGCDNVQRKKSHGWQKFIV